MRRFAPFTMPDPGVHNAPIQLSTLADMRTDRTIHATTSLRQPEVHRAYKLVEHALRHMETHPAEAHHVVANLRFLLSAADQRIGRLELPRTVNLLAKVASSTARAGKTGRSHRDARDTLARMMEKSGAFDVVSMKDARTKIDNARKRREKNRTAVQLEAK